MVFRNLLALSPKKGKSASVVEANKILPPYFYVVKQLTRSKARFLLCLQEALSSSSLLQQGAYWVGKTFHDLAKELGLSDCTINRSVTSLRQVNLIKTCFFSPHPTIYINYYTINYDQLWERISGSKVLFSPIKGEAQ